MVFRYISVSRSSIGEKNSPTVYVVWLPAIYFQAGWRPRRPWSRRQAFDVVISFETETVVTLKSSFASYSKRGEYHCSICWLRNRFTKCFHACWSSRFPSVSRATANLFRTCKQKKWVKIMVFNITLYFCKLYKIFYYPKCKSNKYYKIFKCFWFCFNSYRLHSNLSAQLEFHAQPLFSLKPLGR